MVVARITVGRSPSDVAIAPNGVWVTDGEDNTLSRIDPATSKVVETLSLTLPDNTGPWSIAFGEGSLWVTTYDLAYSLDSSARDNPLAGTVSVSTR